MSPEASRALEWLAARICLSESEMWSNLDSTRVSNVDCRWSSCSILASRRLSLSSSCFGLLKGGGLMFPHVGVTSSVLDGLRVRGLPFPALLAAVLRWGSGCSRISWVLPLASTVNLVTEGMDSAVRIQVWTPAARNVRVGTAAMHEGFPCCRNLLCPPEVPTLGA